MLTPQQALDKWSVRWAWVATIPMVQAKGFSVLLLDWATAITSFAAFMLGKDLNTTYDAWLVFLAGLNGFALGAYGVKRSTDIDYAQAKNPPSPVVTVQPPSTVNVVPPAPPVPDVVGNPEPEAPTEPVAPAAPKPLVKDD